jgi:phage-related protein
VSLNDILGDLASMTVHGMSAQQAAQNLTDAIRHMASPTMAQSKELAALGLNATEVSKSLGQQGLSGTIQTIAQRIQSQMGPAGLVVVNLTNALKGLPPPVQKLGQEVLAGTTSLAAFSKEAKALDPISAKQAQSFATLAGSTHTLGTESKSGAEVYQTYAGAMQKAMGDATGLNVALMLTGENSATTANAIKVVSGATAEAGGHVKGWAEIQGTFNQKLAEAKDGFGAMAISIGEKLLPVLTPLVGALAAVMQWISSHQAAATALAAILGGVLVMALVVLAGAAWSAVAALFAADAAISLTAGLVILAVGVIAIAAYEIYKHWAGISGFFEGLWGDVKSIFSTAVGWIGDRIGDIVGFFTGLGGKIGGAISSVGSAIKTGFLKVIDWITAPFKKAFDVVKEFFSQSPGQMAEELGRASGKIVLAIINFCKTLATNFVTGLNQIKTGITTFFTTTLPQFFTQTIPSFAKRVGTDLLNAGKSLLKSLGDGFKQGWQNEVTFWTQMFPQFFTQTVPSLAKRIGTDLLNAGKSVLKSLGDGFKQGWTNEVTFWTNLPTNIKNFFVDAGKWLYQAGKDVISGLWNGIKDFFVTIYDGIKGLITNFINGFKQGLGVSSPSTIFFGIGGDVIRGLWNGITAMWGGFIGFIRGLPGQIIGAVGNLGGILYNAGAACMQGLYNGFVSVWNSVSSWLSSVGSWIANLKGPLDKDRQLLQPHGNAIIQGLMDGMKAQMPALQSHLSDVTKTITSLNGTANATIGVSGVGGAAALNGGTVNHFNFVVQGNVHTTKDLATDLITEFQKRGIRNSGSGLNYGFSTGR